MSKFEIEVNIKVDLSDFISLEGPVWKDLVDTENKNLIAAKNTSFDFKKNRLPTQIGKLIQDPKKKIFLFF